MGLAILANKKQPTLIIVHRKWLFDQWVQRIQPFLGIPSFRIGKIESGSHNTGYEITVATIQSIKYALGGLPASDNLKKLYSSHQ